MRKFQFMKLHLFFYCLKKTEPRGKDGEKGITSLMLDNINLISA